MKKHGAMLQIEKGMFGVTLDYSEAEFVVTQFISVANFLAKKFKGETKKNKNRT